MQNTLSRSQALAALAAGLVLVPATSFAARRNDKPTVARLEVKEFVSFDPMVRRDSAGTARFNLAFRTEPRTTGRVVELIEEIQAQAVAELHIVWTRSVEGQSLLMYNAKALLHECAYLSQQARGRDYDEIGIAMESTHGSLRGLGGFTSDYEVTPTGVKWGGRVA
jgi:hypothetical protein